MPFRAQLKRAALMLPPLRRLYAHTLQQGEIIREQTRALGRVTAERDRLAADVEMFDMQRYELRSAQHRAVAHSEKLAAMLAATEQELVQAKLNVKPAELELTYAKIAAQITRSSAEICGKLGQALMLGNGAVDPVNAAHYLDLLELGLTGQLFADKPMSSWSNEYDPEIRAIGRDWPSLALTMIGGARMRNIRVLVEQAIEENVPGDVMEAGVWRGGACIYMRGIFRAWRVGDRRVWVADSFAGLPQPDPVQYPADTADIHHTYKELAVSLGEVRANFARYGLLDDQVRFLNGWFADTLPKAPVERLAVLRLDGDMFSSTIQSLEALYDKISPGGWLIVDDYILEGCHQAISDFRERRSITEPMEPIDGAAIYWRKQQ